MMVLSGAMFPFDKLNRKIGSVEKVPVIAELMPTRWTYEALMVSQFKDNRYSTQKYNLQGETFYSLQKKISQAEFNKVYRIPELRKAINYPDKLPLLRNELSKISNLHGVPEFSYLDNLIPERFNKVIADSAKVYLDRTDAIFGQVSNLAGDTKDRFYNLNKQGLDKLREDYYNYKLEEIVTKYYERKKILFYKNSIVQNIDPVYLDPAKNRIPSLQNTFLCALQVYIRNKSRQFHL